MAELSTLFYRFEKTGKTLADLKPDEEVTVLIRTKMLGLEFYEERKMRADALRKKVLEAYPLVRDKDDSSVYVDSPD